MVGDTANQAKAAAHVATLARLPTQIVTANSMFADGDLAPAELLVRSFLLEHGNHVEAMRLLARIGLERDVLDDAELLLEAVLHAAPEYAAARFDYATVLLRRHRHHDALQELERLCAAEPGNRAYRTGCAGALVGLGIPEYEAKRFEGRIKAGGVLLSVHCDTAEQIASAKDVLKHTGALYISSAGEASADVPTPAVAAH